MVMCLRDKNQETVVDVELVKDEIYASVDIEEYSKILLNNLDRKEEVIADFGFLDELREWFFEVYVTKWISQSDYKKCKSEIENILKKIGEKYNLYYVED